MARRSEGLTERHHKIMRFLTSFQERNGYSPSIRQIGENIGVNSTSLVDYYLKQLEEMSYIERDNHVSRSIRILQPDLGTLGGRVTEVVSKAAQAVNDFLSIPIKGPIFASKPIPMPSSDFEYYDAESRVDIPASLLPAKVNVKELFALEVKGNSMIDAMIYDGDIVIMRPTQDASNGEMVAVWLDDKDETTLKYFYKENGRIRLQPANPTMDAIYVDNPKDLRIMAKVVMVIRQVKNIPA
jgi:repressor LexA